MNPRRLFVVRHAKAGQRSEWDGDDIDRPLSAAGRRQAAGLAERLAPETPSQLYASPYVRCVQTLEPLGARLGLPVVADERLAEGARFDDVLALIEATADSAVLCSHGDVIPELVDALVRRGIRLRSEPDWRKASVWVLTGDADGFTHAAAEPPPGRDERSAQ